MRNLICHAGGTAGVRSPGQRRGGSPARVPRRVLTGAAGAVISAVVVLTAGCAQSSTPSSSGQPGASSPAPSSAASPAAAQHVSGSAVVVHFPARLFGLPRYTKPSVRRLAHEFTQNLASFIANAHPQGAVYGTYTSNTMVIVAIAKVPAQASVGGLSAGLQSLGVNGVRRLPAGRGVTEACGTRPQWRTTAIWCARRDAKAVGLVEYFDWGTPTSLSEVASKTNRMILASRG